MQGIKNMLLGIAIMLAVIVFNLFYEHGLWTDFIAVIGMICVVKGYIVKEKESNGKPIE